jgi:hypothetical protein
VVIGVGYYLAWPPAVLLGHERIPYTEWKELTWEQFLSKSALEAKRKAEDAALEVKREAARQRWQRMSQDERSKVEKFYGLKPRPPTERPRSFGGLAAEVIKERVNSEYAFLWKNPSSDEDIIEDFAYRRTWTDDEPMPTPTPTP